MKGKGLRAWELFCSPSFKCNVEIGMETDIDTGYVHMSGVSYSYAIRVG